MNENIKSRHTGDGGKEDRASGMSDVHCDQGVELQEELAVEGDASVDCCDEVESP